jgi:catechol 2,3-dioxygenase-like lactoylglutathione lyase family enzyme
MRFAVDRLDHLVINCRDLEVMASWYQRVLGMERFTFGEPRREALRFGGQKINLRPHDAPTSAWIAAANTSPGTQDLCFVVTLTALDVVAHLHECGVTIETGPVERDGALGPMKSVYCRDPEGNLIEVSSYSG